MKNQNSRIELYYNILRSVYGEDYTEFLTTMDSENNLLILKDYSKEIWKLINKERIVNQACDECKIQISDLKYSTIHDNRIMDFPCWDSHFPLDFNKDHIKSIFVLGIDPGPKIRTDIHIAYELGMYPVLGDGKYDFSHIANKAPITIKESIKEKVPILRDEEKCDSFKMNIKRTNSCKFWQYFKELFGEKLDFVRENIYITDICKCFESKRINKENVIRQCTNKYLGKEIELINPKLIIGQGNIPFEEIFRYFELSRDNEIQLPNSVKISQNFPKLFKKKVNKSNQEIYFAKIYHTSKNNDAKWKNNIDKFKVFFQNYIYQILEFKRKN